MSWVADLSNGELRKDGILAGSFYSGFGEGKMNPSLCHVVGVGPIPPGWYTIGRPFDSPRTGPFVMTLTPDPDTETYGRTDFEIHGDSLEHPGQASHGCIVSARYYRVRIADSGDERLQVITARMVPDHDGEISV